LAELHRHDIKTVRHTFAELAELAQVDPESNRLLLPSPLQPDAEPLEVAVIYYRSAYTPTDYPSATEWETRLLLERSQAIKCPTMALQLAGAKKIQQVLAEPGVLEDFLLGSNRPDVGFGVGAGSLTQEDVEKLRKTWIGLWPMDNTPLGQEAYRMALEESERFVLKPQREGGGNNIYRGDIPTALKKLEAIPTKQGEPDGKEAYILMELIKPPEGVSNWLVRGGENKARKADVVSELGVYGVMLFSENGKAGGKQTRPVNREAGTLLRTKGRESDEGGVAIGGYRGFSGLWLLIPVYPGVSSGADVGAGISSIDSPLLV
jgi:glutathione synthase